MCQIMLTTTERKCALDGLKFVCAKGEASFSSYVTIPGEVVDFKEIVKQNSDERKQKVLSVLKDVAMFMIGVDRGFLEKARKVTFQGESIIVKRYNNKSLYNIHSWVSDDQAYSNESEAIDNIILLARKLEDDFGLTINLKAFQRFYR